MLLKYIGLLCVFGLFLCVKCEISDKNAVISYLKRETQAVSFPVCSDPCENGYCAATNKCECLDGYKKSENNICQAVCSKPCVNSICTLPNICECNTGYEKHLEETSADEICYPSCPVECGNGTCIAPNTCSCSPGYYNIMETKYEDESDIEEPVCKPICKNCEGTCVEPNVCLCDPELETKNEALGGGECNCFENCSDVSKKCERTICLAKGTTDSDYHDEGLDSKRMHTNDSINLSTKNRNIDNTTTKEMFMRSNKVEQTSSWIYVAVVLITLLFITMLLFAIVKRHTIINYFRQRTYFTEDDFEETSKYSSSMGLQNLSTNNVY